MILKFYDYLFYHYYRLFKLIKRRKNIDHKLASSFLSIIIVNNILTFSIASGLLKLISGYSPIVFQIMVLTLMGSYFFNRTIFLKNNRYKTIIKNYENANKSAIVKGRVFIIAFTFLTFLMLPLVGWIYGRPH